MAIISTPLSPSEHSAALELCHLLFEMQRGPPPNAEPGWVSMQAFPVPHKNCRVILCRTETAPPEHHLPFVSDAHTHTARELMSHTYVTDISRMSFLKLF